MDFELLAMDYVSIWNYWIVSVRGVKNLTAIYFFLQKEMPCKVLNVLGMSTRANWALDFIRDFILERNAL